MSILDDEIILIKDDSYVLEHQIHKWLKNHCDLRKCKYKIKHIDSKSYVDVYGEITILPFVSKIPIDLFSFRKLGSVEDYYVTFEKLMIECDIPYYAPNTAIFSIGLQSRISNLRSFEGMPTHINNPSLSVFTINNCNFLKSYKTLNPELFKILQVYSQEEGYIVNNSKFFIRSYQSQRW